MNAKQSKRLIERVQELLEHARALGRLRADRVISEAEADAGRKRLANMLADFVLGVGEP